MKTTATYRSVIYDMTHFGITKIKDAKFLAIGDSSIQYSVSFNGGTSFRRVEPSERFTVDSSMNKIIVKIDFTDTNSQANVFTIKAVGAFQNLQNGTSLFFRKKSTKKVFKTTIGIGGSYAIDLERGIYTVFVEQSGSELELLTNFDPELFYSQLPRTGLDKESTIRQYIEESTWARYCVFDTFATADKIHSSSTTTLDMYGNLSDGVLDNSVQHWAILFSV